MAQQTTAFSLAGNSPNLIEGRRQLMEILAPSMAQYAYFGERPQHDGTVTIKSDWQLQGPPSDGDLVGVATEAQVDNLTSAADTTVNHFSVRAKKSEYKFDATGGAGAAGSLGQATDDFQTRNAMAAAMIEISGGFGSNYASVKKDNSEATRATAGTPATFFNQRLNIGSGTPAAPAGYNPATEVTAKLADNSSDAQEVSLSVRHVVEAASQMAGNLATAYDSDSGFVMVCRAEEHDYIATQSSLAALAGANRTMMKSTNVGTNPGAGPGLEINVTLTCIDTGYGKVYLLPTLRGHNTAAVSSDHKKVAYLTRGEFTGVVYSGPWEKKRVEDTVLTEKPAIRCIQSYFPPPRRGGIVIQGNK